MSTRAPSPWCVSVSTSLLWIVVPSVELEMLVVVLLLDGNNNNNNNNILRINRDDVTLVMSGKFKDCVLSWMFGQKTVASSVHKFWYRRLVCFFRAHVPGCVNGQYFWCIGAAFLREFDVQPWSV